MKAKNVSRIKRVCLCLMCLLLVSQIISMTAIKSKAASSKPGIVISNNVSSDYQTITFTTNCDTGVHGYQVKELYFGKDSGYSKNKITAISSSVNTHTYKITDSGTYYYYKHLYRETWSEGVYPVITHLGGSEYFESGPITFYKTVLNANGGSCAVNQVIVEAGKFCVFPQAFREGYLFKGWSEASWATSGIASYMPAGDSVFYACWEPDPSYNPPTEADTTAPVISAEATNNRTPFQTLMISMQDESGLMGYRFGTSPDPADNTYTQINGSPNSYRAGEFIDSAGRYYLSVIDVNGNVAALSIDFFMTSLNASGGSVTPNQILTESGKTFSLPTPVKEGGIFKGWSKSKTDSSGITSLTPCESATYYAVWEDSGVVCGDADGDNDISVFDATCIQRYLADLYVQSFDEASADADEDGSVTIFDATEIQRYLASLPSNPHIGKRVG